MEDIKLNKQTETSGGFWTLGSRGLTYISYCDVELTEWQLLYEGKLTMVLPLVIPMLLMKVLLYIALCWAAAHFGRRFLKHQLTFASHLMERVSSMQKELFRMEQADYEGLLDLTQQGLTDQLTGLSTRNVFIIRFSQLADCNMSSGMLCFIDLDNLKTINDTYGHNTGDHAILAFSNIIKLFEQTYNGISARYGGDEFIIVFTETTIDEGERIVDELCKALSTSIQIDNNTNTIIIHGSIGVVFYPKHGDSLDVLVSKADVAIYISKHNGKHHYSIYEDQEQVKM